MHKITYIKIDQLIVVLAEAKKKPINANGREKIV
tara:strand:+ start:134 stop:235 length:102 start_codon:yes stop_codon:yes gene_type:complete